MINSDDYCFDYRDNSRLRLIIIYKEDVAIYSEEKAIQVILLLNITNTNTNMITITTRMDASEGQGSAKERRYHSSQSTLSSLLSSSLCRTIQQVYNNVNTANLTPFEQDALNQLVLNVIVLILL
jgi:hypothetical protein